MIDQAELQRLKTICEAATPGPGLATSIQAGHDATFIAESRTAMPKLIAEVERLYVVLEKNREVTIESHHEREALENKLEDACEEITRLKSLTTDNPEHGNEYETVMHYKEAAEMHKQAYLMAKESAEMLLEKLKIVKTQLNYLTCNPLDINSLSIQVLFNTINGDEK